MFHVTRIMGFIAAIAVILCLGLAMLIGSIVDWLDPRRDLPEIDD